MLIFENDNYYLVCYDDKHAGTANYRLDRMDEVQAEQERRSEREEYVNFNPHTYRRQSFSMYAGDLTDVELSVAEPLIDEIFDTNDYNFKSHRRRITHQNTYFNERFVYHLPRHRAFRDIKCPVKMQALLFR